jgi:hypothetical protein
MVWLLPEYLLLRVSDTVWQDHTLRCLAGRRRRDAQHMVLRTNIENGPPLVDDRMGLNPPVSLVLSLYHGPYGRVSCGGRYSGQLCILSEAVGVEGLALHPGPRRGFCTRRVQCGGWWPRQRQQRTQIFQLWITALLWWHRRFRKDFSRNFCLSIESIPSYSTAVFI